MNEKLHVTGISTPIIANSPKASISLPLAALRESDSFCWKEVGVYGDGSCPRLPSVVHCQNCTVFSDVGKLLFEREPPKGVLEERTTLAALPIAIECGHELAGLLFRLGREWMVLDATSIIEVAEPRIIRRIPRQTGQVFLGIVNIRGELRLAFDVRHLMGISPTPAKSQPGERLVVARLDRQVIVFPSDEVSQIIRFGSQDESPVPSSLERWNSTLVKSVITWDNKKIGRIDTKELQFRLNKHLG